MKVKIDSIYPINIDVSTAEGKEFLVNGININYTVYSGFSELSGSTRIEHDGGYIKDFEKLIEQEIKQRFK